MSVTSITVLTREECHLCDEAIGTIRRVAEETGTAIEVREVDVDEDPRLRSEYGDRVPYVFVDGNPAFKFHVDEAKLRSLLERADAD